MRWRIVPVAVLLLVGAAMAGTYQPAGYQGSGRGGQPIVLGATLSDNGEPARVSVYVAMGEDVRLRVAVAFDGSEMWSTPDVDSTAVLEPDAGDARGTWTYSYTFPGQRAYDGDQVSIWAWVYNDDGEWLASKTTTFDLPSAIHHAIVQSVDHDAANCASALYAEYVAAGADVYTYGEGGDLPMAYCVLDRGDWDNVTNYATSGAGAAYLTTAVAEDYSFSVAAGDSMQMLLIRCPLEDLLGNEATVIEARYNVCGSVDLQQSPNDTLVAILDEVPTDNLWWQNTNLGGWNGRDGMTFSGWRHQIQGRDDTVDATTAITLESWGAPVTCSGAWDWPGRQRYEDIGRYQFTSEPHTSRGFASTGYRWLDGDWFGWRINRLVQHAANGATNNGILYAIRDGDEWQLDMNLRYPGTFHSYSGLDHEMPFYTISWIDKPYSPVLPVTASGQEAECLAVFSTDDGVIDVNDHFADLFESRGLAYSIYMQQQYVGIAEDAYGDRDDLLRWLGQGMEIGNHGFRGFLQSGYDTTGTAAALRNPAVVIACEAPTEGGNFTHQLRDFNPCWLFDESTGLGPDYISHPLVGRTHSVNLGTTTWPALLAANRAGVLGARRIGQKRAYRAGTWPAGGWLDHFSELSKPTGAPGATATDTCYAVFPVHNAASPFNYMGMLNTLSTTDLVGDEEATPTQADVVAAVSNRLTAYTGLGVRLLSMYAHAEKNHGYSDGITADELAWVLDVLEDRGVRVMTWAEFQAWRRGRLVPAATPASWGNYATWKSPEATGLWGRLRWLDACKLQGIKRQGS